MAINIAFSALMGVIVWFFVLSRDMASTGAWAWAIALVGLFAAMRMTGKISVPRRAFMVSFAILFAISFVGNLYDAGRTMVLTPEIIQRGEVPVCHIVVPQMILPYALTRTIAFPGQMIGSRESLVGIIILWLLATITIGRGWCGWVCFYGGIEDGFSRVAKKPRLKTLSRNGDIRSFQFAFLAFIVLASLGTLAAVYCDWFCPFKVCTEYFAVVGPESLLMAISFIAIFVGLVVVLPILTRKRTQCSALCPFGSFMSLLDRVSAYRVSIDTDKCVGCMKCAEACPFCAIDEATIREGRGTPELTCAKCGACVDACPKKAIKFAFSFGLKKGKDGKVRACARPEARTAIGRFAQELLSAKNAFLFSAYSFGVIVSSSFGPDAIDRVLSFVTGGK